MSTLTSSVAELKSSNAALTSTVNNVAGLCVRPAMGEFMSHYVDGHCY